MRDYQHLILALLLIAQTVISAGLGDRLVLCLGPHGNLTVEQADHDSGCDHDYAIESDAEQTITDACSTDHSCTDIGLTQQLTNRLRNDRKVPTPPVVLIATFSLPAESATLEHCSRSRLLCDWEGSPSSQPFISTVVLRL